MKRSRLELYEDILAALSEKSLSLDDIAYECKTNLVLLKKHLAFMAEHNLVEEKCIRKKQFYGLTHRGEAVCKTLVLSKRLEKLKPSPALNAALQATQRYIKNKP